MWQTILLFVILLIIGAISGIGAVTTRDVIIGFKINPGTPEEALINSHGGIVKQTFHLIPAIAAKLPEGAIIGIKNDPRVAYIEDDKIFQATDEYTNSWGVQHIGSRLVHNQGINGAGVKIAVLDTGIDYTHPDLTHNYKGGYDFVNNDADPMDDSNGLYINSHGTHVAGTIAAEENGFGAVGVAPNADIYAVKVLSGGGSGAASYIVSGLQWAVDNHMNISTMSFGGPDSISIHNAVDNAYNAGLLLIASAGNGGSVTYPAAYDSVIAVTATDASDQIASFSSIGPEIELAAPGVDIYSTIIGGGYAYESGTSMAAPHVAGVGALIFSTGIRNNTDVRKKLQDTAKDMGDPGKDNIFGFGLVDALNATVGYSAYQPVDLSITQDDGITTVASGDGSIYTYNIMVKNNGPLSGNPLDAQNVKVSDIWPVGFTRGTVTTSQGSCDTSNPTNFTCNLDTIPKDGTATITVNYSVALNTFEGSYTNEADVSSTIPDYNPDNNKAIDTNTIGRVVLNLIRTTSPQINDSKEAYLPHGNYSINIHNINLSMVDMKIYENGVIRKDLSSLFRFNKSTDIDMNINATNTLKIAFVPYGSKGANGIVSIIIKTT